MFNFIAKTGNPGVSLNRCDGPEAHQDIEIHRFTDRYIDIQICNLLLFYD